MFDAITKSSIFLEEVAEALAVQVAELAEMRSPKEYATFYNCNSLSSITIPNSVTKIVANAFEGCSNLSGITIPDNVTSKGAYAFDNCRSLRFICIRK